MILPPNTPHWLLQVVRSFERAFREPMDGPFRLKSYTVATLPDAADFRGGIVYVSNEISGPTIAYSDGTNWLRAADRAIVS